MILVKLASIAFAPLSNDNPAPPATPSSSNTTLIGNGINAGSSPVVIRSSSPQTSNSSHQSMITTANQNGESSGKETLLTFLGLFMIAGVLFYITRPKNKEWFLYEI